MASVPGHKYILAIDLGTSALKVALVTTNGDIVASASEPQQVILLPNGGAEQKPGDWWSGIVRAAHRTLQQNAASVDDIVAVCVTSQWSGTVAVDRAGVPLANALIWMDSRGAKYVNQVVGGFPAIQGYGVRKLWTWLRLTGAIPGHAGKDSIAHILWLKHECPQIYAAATKFLEPKDYLNLKLTGQVAAGYDSITLHWLTDNRNIAHVEYSDQLIKLAGLNRAQLPDLKRATDILGTLTPQVARELGLNENVQVVMGTPDIQSATLGSGAIRDFEAHLYIGTSAWLLCHVPYKKTDLTNNMASLPSPVPNRYLLTNEQESAGACLTYLRDNLFFPDDELRNESRLSNVYSIFDRIAERVPAGSGGVLFTPWLYGERTPVEDHTARSTFFNQSLHTRREHLIRAVFEGVAYNSRWLLNAVEGFTQRRMDPLTMIGGGANSSIWCQIHADVSNRIIRQAYDPVNANVRGVAFLASVALGYLTFDDVPSRIRIAKTYQPNPDHRKLYDDMFAEFLNLYKATKPIHARLNSMSEKHDALK